MSTLWKTFCWAYFKSKSHLSRVIGRDIQICQKKKKKKKLPLKIKLEALQAIGITPIKRAKIVAELGLVIRVSGSSSCRSDWPDYIFEFNTNLTRLLIGLSSGTRTRSGSKMSRQTSFCACSITSVPLFLEPLKKWSHIGLYIYTHISYISNGVFSQLERQQDQVRIGLIWQFIPENFFWLCPTMKPICRQFTRLIQLRSYSNAPNVIKMKKWRCGNSWSSLSSQ
jgi:hypothetical protein